MNPTFGDDGMTKRKTMRPPRHRWTADEEYVLRELYPDATCADVAALLDRAPGSVYQAANRLGLSKSAAFWASDASGRTTHAKQHPGMVANQFKAGLVPWNKGKKGLTGVQEACKATQFKKGEMTGAAQHNYLPIGSYRITRDGYLERKFTDDPSLFPARRWMGVHRLVWQAANGPIPAGHIITFRAGQRTAVLELITADRLECISRAEHARRNHPRNTSPELAKLVQLKGAITRQVNRITREHTERTATP